MEGGKTGSCENMKILILDTTDNKKISVGLKINNNKYILTQKITSNKTQIVLPMIEKILKDYKVKLEDIKEVEVNTGSGSLTGIRVGMAIANTFSFVLGIPVKMIK